MGEPEVEGLADFDEQSGSFAVTGGGNLLTSEADACHLVAQEVEGDFDLSATLDSIASESPDARAGVTYRLALDEGAPAISLLAVAVEGYYTLMLAVRSEVDGVTDVVTFETGIETTDPVSLRLSRVGMRITAYYLSEGSEWREAGTLRVHNRLDGYAGMVVSSVSDEEGATALFGGVALVTVGTFGVRSIADTYVQSDDTLHGGETTMVIKLGEGQYGRESFIRFNLSHLESPRSALLRLYLANRHHTPADQLIALKSYHNIEWSEDTATWYNAPGGLTMPGGIVSYSDPAMTDLTELPEIGTYVYFDVTRVVQEAASGSGDITFNLFAGTFADGSAPAFSTREHSNASRRPALLISSEQPLGLRAAAGPESGSITLRWQPHPGATGYNVYRASSDEGPLTQVATALTAPTWRDQGLPLGVGYWYAISAIMTDGESALSATAYAEALTASLNTLLAAEDSFTTGGPSADTNYGDETTVTVKNSPSLSQLQYHREGYLKFENIAELAHVESAILQLYVHTASGGDYLPEDVEVQFILMPSNDWSQDTVTFNNPPPGFDPPTPIVMDGPASERVTVLAQEKDTVMLVDVTEMVRKAALINNDGTMSIAIKRIDPNGPFNLQFRSLEHGTESSRPRLLYAINRPQPPMVSTEQGYLELIWRTFPNALGYKLYRATDVEGPYIEIAATEESSFKDLSATSGLLYHYKLGVELPGSVEKLSDPIHAIFHAYEKRYPVADTALNGASGYRDINYGSDTALPLKQEPYREVMFKFKVDDLADITSARLRFNARPTEFNNYVPIVNVIVRHGDLGDWIEDQVTYNDSPRGHERPSISTSEPGENELARIHYHRITGSAYLTYLEADVTEAVRAAALAGREYITLFVTGDSTAHHEKGYMSVLSREYEDEEKRPMLLINKRSFGPPDGVILRPRPSEGGFELSWRPVVGASHYIVTRQAPFDKTPVTLAAEITTTSLSDFGVNYWTDGEYSYSVTAVHSDGSVAEPVTVSAPYSRYFTMQAVADTYVRDGDYSDESYALERLLNVKRDTGAGYRREAFIRFSTADLPPFSEAKLGFTFRSFNKNRDHEIVVKVAPDTGWSEDGEESPATWNSILGADIIETPIPDPGDPSLVGRFNIAEMGYEPNDTAYLDITRQLEQAVANGDPSLMVQVIGVQPGQHNDFTLWSLQSAMRDMLPHMVLTIPEYPPQGTLLMLK